MGVLAVGIGKVKEALPFFKTALESNPKIEQFWLSYIDAFMKEKQFRNAELMIENAKAHGIVGSALNILETQLTQLLTVKETKLIVNKKSLSLAKKRKKVAGQKKRKNAKKQSLNAFNPPQQKINNLLHYYQNEQFKEAEQLASSITKEFSKHPFAWKVLGAVLAALGRASEAVKAKQTAVALSPHDAEAYNNLGNTLCELGRLDEAKASCSQAIKLKPDYAQAHNNLANTLKKMGRLEEAKASCEVAISLKPDFAQAHNNLGNALIELERLDEAEASYARAIKLKPNFAQAHSNYGNALNELGRLEEAEASHTRAITLKPDFAQAYNNLGNTLKAAGKLDEAKASYTQAITLDPDFAEAYRHLTLLTKLNHKDEVYKKMQKLYLNEKISEEQRCHINFALAKACEDLGNFEQAFAHYNEGNELRKKLLNYDIKHDVNLFEAIKSNYPRIKQYSLKPSELPKSLTPIFIVGMPRSGTTLVEQIISAHSQVTGAGELPFAAKFGAPIATNFGQNDDNKLLNFRSNYLNALKRISNGNLIVTDKMPQNFRYIGLLTAAFPEAKIVHVKRNSAAVCWANYKQYFTSKSVGYCYAIDHIVGYYKLYENLMNFWTNTLDNRVYELDYERLTVDQESETRQLVAYLDLDWDAKCLSPQHNKRVVTTASNVQVRKKVYQGSSQQWKKYQPFLKESLDDLLLPLETLPTA